MRKSGSGSGSRAGNRLLGAGILAVSLVGAGCAGPPTASFRGTGNEPGWNIEIRPATTVFVTNYGEERHEFATPQPAVAESGQRKSYRAEFDGHEILVELTPETCADTMSDETFPMRVRVELDGRELHGCGRMQAD